MTASSFDPPRTNPYMARICESCGAEADPETMKIRHKVSDETPTMDELAEWTMDSICRATDGCEPVEPDGRCEHGHQSWLLAMGMI